MIRNFKTGLKKYQGTENGFTIVELMVTLVISLFAIMATTSLFAQLFARFKQESRVAQTDIGSELGLEYLRREIHSAGYGLPWVVNGVAYAESSVANATTDDAPSNPPRAIFTVPGGGLFGSDWIVIKSQMAASMTDSAAGRSTTLRMGNVKRVWGNVNDDFVNSDNVIVLSTIDNTISLVNNAGAFSVTYNNTAPYAPASTEQTNMIYGVANTVDASNGLRMPFNRADYFITNSPAIAKVPLRCAPGTGELVKAIMNPDKVNGGGFSYFPVLDCVANMKVEFQLANNIYDNGTTVATYSAAQIRQNLKEVLVYILAQEGQKEPSYTSAAQIPMNDPMGNNFPNLLNGQLNYRWKVYTIVEHPMDLTGE
ncbi:MAG: hypothetical protein M0Z61_02080 [Nitrospiraceae bacterium]|nr:hypothetical protein [Nitrospiraceae bacterium]